MKSLERFKQFFKKTYFEIRNYYIFLRDGTERIRVLEEQIKLLKEENESYRQVYSILRDSCLNLELSKIKTWSEFMNAGSEHLDLEKKLFINEIEHATEVLKLVSEKKLKKEQERKRLKEEEDILIGGGEPIPFEISEYLRKKKNSQKIYK